MKAKPIDITEGPWKLDPFMRMTAMDVYAGELSAEDGKQWTSVANVWFHDSGVSVGKNNAALIAASPSLYKGVRKKLKAEAAVLAQIEAEVKRSGDSYSPSTAKVLELDALSREASKELLAIIGDIERAAG